MRCKHTKIVKQLGEYYDMIAGIKFPRVMMPTCLRCGQRFIDKEAAEDIDTLNREIGFYMKIAASKSRLLERIWNTLKKEEEEAMQKKLPLEVK